MNPDTSSWKYGEDTILRYSLYRKEDRIKIECNLGYVTSFNWGGPIAPLEYLHSPTACPFRWDFPILDFKVLNNQQVPLFLTEVVFDVEQSRPDPGPLLTINRDTQLRHAGDLLLVNEGFCNLIDLTISFHLLPGSVAKPIDFGAPFRHSISLPILRDYADVDVTQAFRAEGVDIDGLILLANGKWDQDTYVVPKADGSQERMTEAEVEEREEKCLGRFQDEVGTLAGEINFTTAEDAGRKYRVKFHAPVQLANQNRMGIPRPPTYAYDTAFDALNTNYQRRVQISQELQPGETDRFTLKVAISQPSFHRFRATLRDITGLALQSLPVEMNCFVPRSRRKRLEAEISAIATK